MPNTNLRATLAAKVREIAPPEADESSSAFKRGRKAGVIEGLSAAAQLIAESPELGEVEQSAKHKSLQPILICDGCGRLWVDDDASDSESCETEGCGRFKQRMEWANAQEIEDRDTKLLAELTQLRSECEALRKDAERLNWLESTANGIAVLHDDESEWVVASSGMQSLRSTLEADEPWGTTFIVDSDELGFRGTIREAIDAAIGQEVQGG